MSEKKRCMWCGAKHVVGSSIWKTHQEYLKDTAVNIRK